MSTVTLWLLIMAAPGGGFPVVADRFVTAQDCQQAAQRLHAATNATSMMKPMVGACVEAKVYKP